VRIVVEVAADIVVAALGERLVLWYAPPLGSCVAARSRMRSRAAPGPFARSPAGLVRVAEAQPRPIPDSKNDAERDMLNVPCTDRRSRRLPCVVCRSGVVTWQTPSKPSSKRARLRSGVRVGLIQVLRDDRLHRLLVDNLGARRIEFLATGFS